MPTHRRLEQPPAAKGSASRFLTIETAALHVGLSISSIRRLLAAGRITALRPIRGRVLIDRLELEAFVLSSSNVPRTGRGRH